MRGIYLYTCIFIVYLSLEFNEGAERVNFLNFERPVISYLNNEHVKEAKCTSRRLSRKDPRHYVHIYFYINCPIDNNIHVDFYLYEYAQGNAYRRTLIEMHWKACDMIDKDQYIGRAFKQHWVNYNKNMTCPYPSGAYYVENGTMPFVSTIIPIKRGRVYLNVSREFQKKNILIASAYIDLEVKKL